MIYTKENNKIIINDMSQFNAEQIFLSGQVFSYDKLDDKNWRVLSNDKCAYVHINNCAIEIETNDVDYFIDYFDLNTDYAVIKNDLLKNNIMKNPINFGYGIRILKQDILEIIISFVISANNNIPRIRGSLSKIRAQLGTTKDGYFAFPTLEQLAKADQNFFESVGTGYRAKSLVKLIQQLKEIDFEELKNLSTEKLRTELIKLSGVGPKVADCIILFGFGRKDVFPVDTWIEKMFNMYFYNQTNREIINRELLKTFGCLSGYAQQYLFYYQRLGKY